MSRKREKKVEAPPPTGWSNGLSQDYNRELANWFSSRLDAKAVLRRWFGGSKKLSEKGGE